MYKVLIVDDERLIREGLATLIDWQAQGFEVAALAADGQQALETIAAQPIDLVLADIRMPRLGGLELLETLRRDGRRTRFLILSGFAEFAYAQRAAAGRIDGYLLKPVDEEELCARLAEVRRDLDGQRLSALTLIGGNPALPPHLDWGRWQVLLVLAPPASPSALRTTAAERGWGEVFDQPPQVGLLLKQVYPRGYNLDALVRELEEALGSRNFFAAVGDVVSRSAEIPASYAQAQRRLSQRFFARPGTIVFSDRQPAPAHSPPDAELGGPLALAFEARSLPAVAEALQALKTTFLATGADEDDVKTRFARLLPGAGPWVAGLWGQPTLDDLIAFAQAELEAQFQGPPSAQVSQRLLEILESRYSENLKLESLADAFQYNSAYLGKLFRAQTGESFHTALDRIRIGRAQELLKQGYKVYQVAELVGYRYVDYFHAKFKKHTGVAPSDFRGDPWPKPPTPPGSRP